MSELKVFVVEFSDRNHYQMRWVDPTTGRKKTKTTGVRRTGRARERREAERVAAQHENALRSGKYQAPSKMTWEEFRERHEAEAQPGMAEETIDKYTTTFNLVERILTPNRLRELTTDRISTWVAELRKDRADTTVGIYCRHLKAALRWAAEMGFLPEAPKIREPKVPAEELMKGRAITGEEHERLLMSVPKVVAAPVVPLWRRFLEGLWWSGLRLSEAVRLSWEATEPICVIMQPGYRPAIRFLSGSQKARRSELVPCAPEFAELLEAVPEEERTGRVFELPSSQKTRAALCIHWVGKIVAQIGRAAVVIVDEKKEKAASAHDYRRAFGTRWAKRVKPATLKRLMRHKNIQTTLRYYVDQDAEDVAEDLWRAYGQVQGNTFGNTLPKTPLNRR